MILETSVSSSFMRYGSLSSRGGGTAADPRLIFPLHRGSTAQNAWALQTGRAGPPWWGRGSYWTGGARPSPAGQAPPAKSSHDAQPFLDSGWVSDRQKWPERFD